MKEVTTSAMLLSRGRMAQEERTRRQFMQNTLSQAHVSYTQRGAQSAWNRLKEEERHV